MKNFWKVFKSPLVVGVVALVIYIFDNLVGKLLYPNGSFTWVAFIAWTIFFGVSIKDRIQGLIGTVIGFLFGVFMYFAPTFFPGTVFGISIAGMLIVLLANCAMMLFSYLRKFWLHSLSGIFMGVSLTFSGLGVGLYPSTVENAFTSLGIMLLYVVLGLLAGFICKIFTKDKKDKELVEKENQENIVEEQKVDK